LLFLYISRKEHFWYFSSSPTFNDDIDGDAIYGDAPDCYWPQRVMGGGTPQWTVDLLMMMVIMMKLP
jgi:hypothetical protein